MENNFGDSIFTGVLYTGMVEANASSCNVFDSDAGWYRCKNQKATRTCTTTKESKQVRLIFICFLFYQK